MRFRWVIAAVTVVAACSSGSDDSEPVPSGDPTTTQQFDESVSTTTLYTGFEGDLDAQARARQGCEDHDPAGFLNYYVTTVGAARQHTIGSTPPMGGAIDHEFAGFPDDTVMAWCWHRVGDEYESFVVGPDGRFIRALGKQADRPEPGPPQWP